MMVCQSTYLKQASVSCTTQPVASVSNGSSVINFEATAFHNRLTRYPVSSRDQGLGGKVHFYK